MIWDWGSAKYISSLPAVRFHAAGAVVRHWKPRGRRRGLILYLVSFSCSITPTVLLQLSRVFVAVMEVNLSLQVFPVLRESALFYLLLIATSQPAPPQQKSGWVLSITGPSSEHLKFKHLRLEPQLQNTPPRRALSPDFAGFLLQALIIPTSSLSFCSPISCNYYLCNTIVCPLWLCSSPIPS